MRYSDIEGVVAAAAAADWLFWCLIWYRNSGMMGTAKNKRAMAL